MNQLFITLLLAMPALYISPASATSPNPLDYCATVESWTAQKIIDKFAQKNKNLDPLRATSYLMVRTALTDHDTPVTLGEWGQLYTQTIKISLPFIDHKTPSMTIIASSIISAEECSLSEPSFVNMALP